MSWWRRKAEPQEFDVVKHFSASLNQGEAILRAEMDGRKAWRILVTNHMLSDQWLSPRQYRFSVQDLAQISGVPVENVATGTNANECNS